MRRLLAALLLISTPAFADGLSGGSSSVAVGGDISGAGTVTSIQGTPITGTTGTGNVVLSTVPTISGAVLLVPTLNGTVVSGVSGTGSAVLSNSSTLNQTTFTGNPGVTATSVNVTGSTPSVTSIYRPTGTNTLGLTASSLLQVLITATSGTFIQQLAVPAMTTSSAAQTGTVCWSTGTGALTADTTVACLASLEELKNIKGPITGALAEVMRLNPFWFTWKPGTPQAGDTAEQPGLGAHAVEAVDKRLVGYGPDGALRGVRYQELTAVLVAAIQEQQVQIDALKAQQGFWKGLAHTLGF